MAESSEEDVSEEVSSQTSDIDSDVSSDSELEAHLHTRGEFFGCYLLVSVSTKFKGRTYIGFTVDPNRRIRQHNRGYHKGGARKTSGKGPWEMVLIVHGFPNHIAALRFEWAWQNPARSRRLGKALQKKKRSESALKYRFRILARMLSVGPWCRLPLTIRWLKQEYEIQFPPDQQPPIHMPIAYGAVDLAKAQQQEGGISSSLSQPASARGARQCRSGGDSGVGVVKGGVSGGVDDDGDVIRKGQSVASCQFCPRQDKSVDLLHCYHKDCPLSAHVTCLAPRLLASEPTTPHLIPVSGPCPHCHKELLWGELVKRYMASTKTEGSDKEVILTRKRKAMSSSQPTGMAAPPPPPTKRNAEVSKRRLRSHWSEQLHM